LQNRNYGYIQFWQTWITW